MGGPAESVDGKSSSPGDDPVECKSDAATVQETEKLSGWRLHGTTFTCQLCVFLANLEVAIVSTTLIDITDSLRSFKRSSWVITAYLLTYTGFLLIWSKLSDSLGRRQCLCAAIVLFTVASGACGGAQTATQLIVFRAFQGIGGSGLLSLNFVILPEMVGPKKYALYSAFTSCAFVLGFLFGPLFGGAIVLHTTWRWVFLLNLPICLVTLILVYIFMPVGFPDLKATSGRLQLSRLREIDLVGSLLIFGACALVVSALEEAGWNMGWQSPTIIILLVLSVVFTVTFPCWQHLVDRGLLGKTQAIFTTRLMKNRLFMADLLITFFVGVNFTTSVIQIPQEWQTIARTDPLVAGVRLLPFLLFYSVGTVMAMLLSSKAHVPPVFVVLMGAALQTIATCVMSLVPVRQGAGKYICECILGIGVGENIGIMVQLTPQLIRGKDQAAAMGAVTQFRALGGVVGFAITTNVFNAYIKAHLAEFLSAEQITHLLESYSAATSTMAPTTLDMVATTFAQAYDLNTMILIGFSAAQAASVVLLWEKRFRRLI